MLEGNGLRLALAAMDWCGVGGATFDRFCSALAHGLATSRRNVWLHTVHQHAAPYVVEDAYPILQSARPEALRMSARFLALLSERLARAAAAAMQRLEPVERIGIGIARVGQVASARRLLVDGRLVTRFSSTAKSPRTGSAARGRHRPGPALPHLVRQRRPDRAPRLLCHPSADLLLRRPRLGRLRRRRAGRGREGNGMPGDLLHRLRRRRDRRQIQPGQGRAAPRWPRAWPTACVGRSAALRSNRSPSFDWRIAPLRLEPRRDAPAAEGASTDAEAYRRAITAAFARRQRPLAA